MAQYWLADIPGTTISSSEGERIAVLGRDLSSTTTAASVAALGDAVATTTVAATLGALGAVTASAAEISNKCDGSASYYAASTGTAAITAANSGKTIFVGSIASTMAFLLPTEAAGLNYKIVYAGAAEEASNITIGTEAAANYFVGGLTHEDLDGETVATVYAASTGTDSLITVVTPGAGTEINLLCTGTLWYVWGKVISATVPTIAST